MRVSFAANLFFEKRVCHEEEALFSRADRGGAQAGRIGDAGGRYYLAGWLEEAKVIIEAWRRAYNENRPHMALGGASPLEFARKLGPRAQFLSALAAEN